MHKAMRAAVVKSFGGPENIGIEEIPVPEAGNSQVLVKVNYAAVNPVDTYIRAGNYGVQPQLPYVPGIEGSGEVSKVGSSVTHVKEGDRVWFVNGLTGSCAEYCLVSAELAFPLPNNVSFEQGATLGIAYITAYRALFVKAGAQAGQSVFIHGISGGVGLAACQVAKTHGLRVCGSASSAEGAQLAMRFGAEEIFNHKEPDYVQKIASRRPNGFDIILEMVADANLNTDLGLINKFGRIIIIGGHGGIEIMPRSLMLKESAIVGVYPAAGDVGDYQRIAERINGLLAGSHISPFVGKTLPLEQVSLAHQLVMDRHAPKIGRIILEVCRGNSAENVPPQPQPVPAAEPNLPAPPAPAANDDNGNGGDVIEPQNGGGGAADPQSGGSADPPPADQPSGNPTIPVTGPQEGELGDFVHLDS